MQSRLMFHMLAPTMAVSLTLLILGSAAAWYVHRLQRESASALRKNVEKVTVAEKLVIASHDLRHELSLYLATNDESHLQEGSQLTHRAEELVARCQKLSTHGPESELIQRIGKGYRNFYGEFNTLSGAESISDASPVVFDLIHGVTNREILTPAEEYCKLIGAGMDQAAKQDQILADRMGLGLFVFGTCGAVAGLVAGFGFARSVHRSIVQLTVPVHDTAGKLSQVVGPIDISGQDLGELESMLQAISDHVGTVIERLHESHAVARRAEQLASLGQLAAGIAHELRNPLTSMKIIVQTAADQGNATSLDERDMEVLWEEVSRMEATIQSFLDYARPPNLLKQQVIIRDEIERTLGLLALRAARTGVYIEREISEDACTVDADPVQLRQVLLNLLINALEVSPDGGTVRVRLGFRPHPGSNGKPHKTETKPGFVQVDVEDEGPGLPAEVGASIFEPFITTKDSGTGLGLAICKRIVDDHGGDIRGANRPEGGAVFSVRLPIVT